VEEEEGAQVFFVNVKEKETQKRKKENICKVFIITVRRLPPP
jgi:hypothetical protein